MKKRALLVMILVGLIIGHTSVMFAQEITEETAPTKTEENVFDLGTVVVSAKGGDVDTATTVTSVSIEDIENSGAKNVAEALELVPGIDIQMGTKGMAGLKLRGVDQKNIRVLIDGVPAHETYDGSLDLGQISVNSVARIDVTKGAASVMYGANTLGGVINIITKKGTAEPETSVSIALGQNATQEIVVNHGASIGKLNYWITASTAKSDGYSLSQSFDPSNDVSGIGTEYNEDGGIRDLSYYTKNTLSAKIGYEADDDTKAYLTFDYHANEHGCPTVNNTYWEYNKWNQWHLNLVGEHAFSDFFSMKAKLYYVDHDDTLEDVSWDNDHKTTKKYFEQSAYEDSTSGLELQSYLDFGEMSLLKIGFSYISDTHKQTDYYDATTQDVLDGKASVGYQPSEEYSALTYTLAVEDEIMPTDNLLVIIGFSSDTYQPVPTAGQGDSYQTSALNPQVGIVYDLSESTKLHASVGQKTRFPQLKELYSNMAGGNPNLKPQKATNTEVGASSEISDKLNTTVSLFSNQYTDKIDRIKVSGVRYYVNIGQATITGLELAMDYDISDRFNTGINYTYLDSKEKADDSSNFITADYTPNSKLILDLAYEFGSGLNTYFQAIYTGDQVYYDGSTEKAIDPFTLMNVKVTKDLKSVIGFTSGTYLEIKNLMDVDYEEGNGPQPGRSIMIGMNMTF